MFYANGTGLRGWIAAGNTPQRMTVTRKIKSLFIDRKKPAQEIDLCRLFLLVFSHSGNRVNEYADGFALQRYLAYRIGSDTILDALIDLAAY